jgi:Zn-dependent alcohol dehydrogenase
MKTRAALYRMPRAPLQIEDIELDRPAATEVLVRVAAVGLCRTEEEIMPVTSAVAEIVAKVSEWVAAMRRMSKFTCGDCERSDRCGLPPSDLCVARLEQIARGDWRARRTKALVQTGP